MDKTVNRKDAGAHLQRLIALDKRELPSDGGAEFNRLIFAFSPYLLQHAENPVDWYPWGEQAFAKAKEEDKPIFLSIGYATCHWCHVMAHESFEDREAAEVLNRNFVAIKVDREERPDIDDQYMTVSQMMTGSGGWPLQVIMTPHREPFFTVTYLPKHGRRGMPGLIEVLEQIANLWRTRRESVLESCAAVMQSLNSLSAPSPGVLGGTQIMNDANNALAQMYDSHNGGFGTAPKFPMPHYGSFLLRHKQRAGSGEALRMTEHTLRAMRGGGICDQLGFGFHRYSVDPQWLVPHFEKMLYDQALIALVYLEAFQSTGDRFHQTCAEEIFSYLLREMTAPAGGFYSAQDADTEGEEGKYYVWSPDEVVKVLGREKGRIFCRLFDVTERGNFEGENILHLNLSVEEFAEQEGMPYKALQREMAEARELLLAAREQRIRPLRDEKVVTAWNGLAIAAFARGGAITGDERWLSAAFRAVSFIRERVVRADGRLMRSYHREVAPVAGFLDDYAFFVWGLIELYEAKLEVGLLDEALHYSREMLCLFGSHDSGGFYDVGSDADQLLVRTRTAYDGVIPSGNSVAAGNLVKLGRITGDEALLTEGEKILTAFMGGVARQPVGYLHFLGAYDFFLHSPVEITVIGPIKSDATMEMLRMVKGRFIPNLVLKSEVGAEGIGGIARVCAAGACRPLVHGAPELEQLLNELV